MANLLWQPLPQIPNRVALGAKLLPYTFLIMQDPRTEAEPNPPFRATYIDQREYPSRQRSISSMGKTTFAAIPAAQRACEERAAKLVQRGKVPTTKDPNSSLVRH